MEDHVIFVNAGRNEPSIRLIFAGGDGSKVVYCFLVNKLLEIREKEGKKIACRYLHQGEHR